MWGVSSGKGSGAFISYYIILFCVVLCCVVLCCVVLCCVVLCCVVLCCVVLCCIILYVNVIFAGLADVTSAGWVTQEKQQHACFGGQQRHGSSFRLALLS